MVVDTPTVSTAWERGPLWAALLINSPAKEAPSEPCPCPHACGPDPGSALQRDHISLKEECFLLSVSWASLPKVSKRLPLMGPEFFLLR